MCGIFARWGRYRRAEAIAQAETLQHRGPDNTQYCDVKYGFVGFHRLSIMDPTSAGNQPFSGRRWLLVCNGEIYNAGDLQAQYLKDVPLASGSDCEVLFALLDRGLLTFEELVPKLYGVYALLAVRHNDDSSLDVYVARDRVGVRPLYYAWDSARGLAFASEPCALVSWGAAVHPFPPDTAGRVHVFDEDRIGSLLIFKTATLCQPQPFTVHDHDEAVRRVRATLEHAVRVRLMTDRPLACMLSGGVDSSAVAALVARFTDQPLHTFSIGLEGSTDLQYARRMAQHLGSVHHEVCLTEQDFLEALPEVVRAIQSYDVTTVRASTPMYLLSRYIAQHTDFKVVFSGEGPDEICGSYMYFHASPSPEASDAECRRLVRDMHYFDILRADRCTARWGLEVRVPLLAVDFLQTYWSIDPALRVPYQGREKWILRQAVQDLLPPEVCWRPKEAYSDGVSSQTRSWSTILQAWIDGQVSAQQMTEAARRYPHHTPQTKEAYWMRQTYEEQYGAELAHLIPYQWLPRWVGAVTDPSARVLPQYQVH